MYELVFSHSHHFAIAVLHAHHYFDIAVLDAHLAMAGLLPVQ